MSSPVTHTLIEQLRRAIVKDTIVLWLDKDAHYTQFVDALIPDGPAQVGAPVLAYRGSYLELLRALAPMTGGVDPSPLLVHVPFANQDSIKHTPLYELNEAGRQFRKGLETLIREAAAGRVTPEQVDGYLAQGEVSLASADLWMAQRVAAADDNTEIVLRGTDTGRLLHDLVSKGPIDRQLGLASLDAVWHFLATQTGLPEDWPTAERRSWAREVEQPKRAELRDELEPAWDPEQAATEAKRRLADLAVRWVLCVEYVHDLQRDPLAPMLLPAKAQARPLIDACRDAAAYLRRAATKYYVDLADDVEDEIEIEITHGEADELGRIDTFRFEEDRLMLAALEAVRAGEWARAGGWAAQRLAGQSVWLDQHPARRKTWGLIAQAAQLGDAIQASALSFADARSLDDATRRYAEHGAPIDRLHRDFEEQAERDLLFDALPHVEQVRAAVEATRASWRAWAERGAQQWSRLCEQDTALPSASLQQRNLYEQVVAPLLDDSERTALFLVDAMRYEMGLQLVELIGAQAASSVHLGPRLAELPSVTEVGMNALAPSVQRGRLHPVLDAKQRRMQGFDAGGFKVRARPDREKLLDRSSGGVRWFEIEDLLKTEGSIRRQFGKARLVVVHSLQIDKAGTAGAGLSEFPRELRRIHMAWQHLRAAGIRRFVFSSDHGFLLRSVGDEEIQHGQGHDPLARYALYPKLVSNDRQLGLSLRNLGYEGTGDVAVIVPRGLAVYQSGKDYKFVHGGNSPQERVIPVLTVVHRLAIGGEDQRYRIELFDEVSGSTSHLLSGRVIRADNQTTLALDVDPIELELRAADGAEVDAEPLECEGAALGSGVITARIGEPFRLRFRLSSAKEQRVRVELLGASATRVVEVGISQARFVSLTPDLPVVPVAVPPASEPGPAQPVQPPAQALGWLDEFADHNVRRVMAHIAEHSQVTEADLIALLGNDPRKARKFARKFDDYRAKAPFLIELWAGPAGKVYRKVTDS